ncbi:MAG TPA: lyase family protein [Gemmatimonadales bacterium]|nr:lyase family protein [Gemmatimonadales bacterium]
MKRRATPRSRTLWSQPANGGADALMLAYTVGDDRHWDARLLPWDVLGSLGHVEGLRRSGLISASDHRVLRAGLRAGLRAARRGALRIGQHQEDAHSAVEQWLTKRVGRAGERLHTGRSRNDQIACDLRLYLKATLLEIHDAAAALALALVGFAARHRDAVWPGYTHQRRAMPSSAGLWAAAFAEGISDTLESLPALWARVDRCPLGSAAGYGVPLPLQRKVAARALGFAVPEHNVAAVQNGRGKLEAAVLAWCAELGHEAGKLATDAVLYSGEEYGLLLLPRALATGSSLMPHKRNPDMFELTRARAAALDTDLVAVLSLKAKLGSGYHRDFQLLKEPLLRGLDRTREMLAMLAAAVPQLGVDRARGAALLAGDALATDEVLRRAEAGEPFRSAYRAVAAELARGDKVPPLSAPALLARRKSPGALGNLDLDAVRKRLRACRRWSARAGRLQRSALTRLAGAEAGAIAP